MAAQAARSIAFMVFSFGFVAHNVVQRDDCSPRGLPRDLNRRWRRGVRLPANRLLFQAIRRFCRDTGRWPRSGLLPAVRHLEAFEPPSLFNDICPPEPPLEAFAPVELL